MTSGPPAIPATIESLVVDGHATSSALHLLLQARVFRDYVKLHARQLEGSLASDEARSRSLALSLSTLIDALEAASSSSSSSAECEVVPVGDMLREQLLPQVQYGVDVGELLNVLLDALQRELGTSRTPFSHEIVTRVRGTHGTCQHEHRRSSSGCIMSARVRNVPNLSESLLLECEADLLDGSNAYMCTECSRKVDALKDTRLGSVPEALLVQLLRFDFDYATFQNVKLNSRFGFPMVLDLAPLLADAADAADAGSHYQNDEQTEIVDISTVMELTGFIAHRGTAVSGEVSSVLCKDGNWWCISGHDGTRAEPVSLEQLPDYYGGDVHPYHSPNVAYILCYERAPANPALLATVRDALLDCVPVEVLTDLVLKYVFEEGGAHGDEDSS